MATPPSPTPEQHQDQDQDQDQATTADDCGFVWDPHSNLYYHASTGFYHDPIAGWYYSTRDSLYYAFQDGAYVPLQSQSQSQSQPLMDEDDAHAAAADADEAPPLTPNQVSHEDGASDHDTRPSQWLDELLINEYLSGYPRQGGTTDDQALVADEGEIDDKQTDKMFGESILDKQENDTSLQNASGAEGMLSAEEESWMAQYGQVERSDADEAIIKAVDLWDWELIEETAHKGHKRKIARLIGQLVGQSTSLHPSLPSSGGTLKTTAIHQVHLDLVLVASGKLYRLRTPSKRYLAMLSEYDSSNPTKDWGFLLLSPDSFSLPSPTTSGSDPNNVNFYPRSNQKDRGMEKRYRDRAEERRRLHGANGIAPCQKDSNSNTGYAFDDDPMIAQEEARLLSFGTESYASKIMQSMGWKQGEALGSSRKGILEPVQARGNIGTAGLGWK